MKYKLGSLIGKGSDGEIYELLDKENISKKVIKFIQPTINGIRNYLEPYIMLHLKHRHLMEADKFELEDNGVLKIIQPRADNDLNKIIKNKKINITTKLKYMRQLTEAVYFLQQHNINHGDIKPHNILIVNDNVKLSDFALARLIMKDHIKCVSKPYTLAYRPPEVNNNILYLKSDIWALACTLYEIYYECPYFKISKDYKTYHVLDNKINNSFDNLISNMLKIDINERHSIDDILIYFNILPNNTKYILKPKLNIEDYNNHDRFLKKCYYSEDVKKISKKYLEIERKIANDFNFYIFENIPEVSC